MRPILKIFIATFLIIPLASANAQNRNGFSNEPGEVFYLEARVIDYQPAYSFVGAGRNSNCSCLLYTSPSPRDRQKSRMPSSA